MANFSRRLVSRNYGIALAAIIAMSMSVHAQPVSSATQNMVSLAASAGLQSSQTTQGDAVPTIMHHY